MRVKTVPRQRVMLSNSDAEPLSKIVGRKFEKSRQSPTDEGKGTMGDTEDGSSRSSVERDERKSFDCFEKALDMSIRRKIIDPEEDSIRCSIAGPSSCEYSTLEEEKHIISNDDNNNVLKISPDVADCCSSAATSSKHSNSCEDKLNTSSSDDDRSIEAVNLCKKDCQEEDASNPSGGSDERLKDTFLYKIMTDPTFLENIQKHKQPKRWMCQFCKQEFSNSDELADHMDVKKDESNQVVCCACKKTFAQKRYLRYHQRCHSERTKFTCDTCTKKYTRLDNLTRHNAFHVNPDKFSCTYCEKKFARKDLLNKHLKCHDNKYRFFCEVCQKYFKGPITLDNHKRIFHAVS